MAYREIPVYRAKYQAAGFKPHLREWDDIQKIPVITKPELVAAFPDQCVNRKFKSEDLFPTRSSGSSGQTLLIRVDYDAILTDTIQGVRQFAMQSGNDYRENDLLAHVYTVPWWFDLIGGKYPTAFISNLIPPSRVAQHLRYLAPRMLSLYPSSLDALMPHVDEFQSIPQSGGDAFGIFLEGPAPGMVAPARRARARRILLRGSHPHRARNAGRQLLRLRGHRASRRARSRDHGSRRRRASPVSRSSPICSTKRCRSSATCRAITSPCRSNRRRAKSTGRRSPASTAVSTTPSSTAKAARSPPAASSMRPIAGCSIATCIWRSSRSCRRGVDQVEARVVLGAATSKSQAARIDRASGRSAFGLPGAQVQRQGASSSTAFPPKAGKRRPIRREMA